MNITTTYRNARRLLRKIEYNRKYRQTQAVEIADVIGDDATDTLFITNDNFGGTRQYENLQRKQIKNLIVLRRISYGERPDLVYELENVESGAVKYLHNDEIQKAFQFSYREIIVNTFVHVTLYKEMISLLVDNKKSYPDTKILYLVHDFNSICPNCNLFVNGHYCELQCKNENCNLYIADNRVLIDDWRTVWENLLESVDEIRCFSESSKRIVLAAYQNLDANKITVVPHDISYIKFTPIPDVDKLPLHLGIIGDCNADFKGRDVVKELINRFGEEVPITLIGSDYRGQKINKSKVKYLGTYQRDDLEKLIVQEQISEVVFPSLWPETFSYLVSELMAMNIPIVGFDIGAQGEKISHYEKGIVCHSEEELFKVIDKQKA